MRIGLLLVAVLTMLCGLSCKAPATKGQTVAEDVKYGQALEYYTLTGGQQVDPRRPGSPSTTSEQEAVRIRELQEAIRSWRHETPDKHVAMGDRKEVQQILEDLFRDPVARQQMVIKTRDLDICEEVTIQFHNKNRCVVSVMFYDRGPRAQAGLDLYLFKHEGRWRIIHRVDWIA